MAPIILLVWLFVLQAAIPVVLLRYRSELANEKIMNAKALMCWMSALAHVTFFFSMAVWIPHIEQFLWDYFFGTSSQRALLGLSNQANLRGFYAPALFFEKWYGALAFFFSQVLGIFAGWTVAKRPE